MLKRCWTACYDSSCEVGNRKNARRAKYDMTPSSCGFSFGGKIGERMHIAHVKQGVLNDAKKS